MEHTTKELEHATGNKRGALRQTRRIYSSFVRGDDVLQDPEDEEEEQAMGVPPESVADPDSSWVQINGTVLLRLSQRSCSLEVRDVRQRPRGAAGAHGNGGGGCAPEGVGVGAHPVGPSDMLNASSRRVPGSNPEH
jgi:hypothetical protein